MSKAFNTFSYQLFPCLRFSEGFQRNTSCCIEVCQLHFCSRSVKTCLCVSPIEKISKRSFTNSRAWSHHSHRPTPPPYRLMQEFTIPGCNSSELATKSRIFNSHQNSREVIVVWVSVIKSPLPAPVPRTLRASSSHQTLSDTISTVSMQSDVRSSSFRQPARRKLVFVPSVSPNRLSGEHQRLPLQCNQVNEQNKLDVNHWGNPPRSTARHPAKFAVHHLSASFMSMCVCASRMPSATRFFVCIFSRSHFGAKTHTQPKTPNRMQVFRTRIFLRRNHHTKKKKPLHLTEEYHLTNLDWGRLSRPVLKKISTNKRLYVKKLKISQ
jgi:hypothetical protein